MFVSAIIVAAGGSTRMGTSDSKQFIPLHGRPAIEHTLRAFQICAHISEVIVVSREQDVQRIFQLAEDNHFDKVKAVVKGGSCRAESVKNGIRAANRDARYFAVHDGARPLITVGEIKAVCEAAFVSGAATLGTAVTDTIKVVDSDGIIQSTPVRSTLRAVQTPQVFEREMYTLALDNADHLENVTDDCSLIEKTGGKVQVVEGSRENIKLTTPVDIVIAESILDKRKEL